MHRDAPSQKLNEEVAGCELHRNPVIQARLEGAFATAGRFGGRGGGMALLRARGGFGWSALRWHGSGS